MSTNIFLTALQFRPLEKEDKNIREVTLHHQQRCLKDSSKSIKSQQIKVKFVKGKNRQVISSSSFSAGFRLVSENFRKHFSSSSSSFIASKNNIYNDNINNSRFDHLSSQKDYGSLLAFLVCTKSFLNATAPRVVSSKGLFPHLRSSLPKFLVEFAPSTVRYTYALKFNQLNDEFLADTLSACPYVQRIEFNYIFNCAYKIDLDNAFEQLHPSSLEALSFTGIDNHHLFKLFGVFNYGGPRVGLVSASPSLSAKLPTPTVARSPQFLVTLEILCVSTISTECLVRVLDDLCLIRRTLKNFIIRDSSSSDYSTTNRIYNINNNPNTASSRSSSVAVINDFFFEFVGQKLMRHSASLNSSLRKLQLQFKNAEMTAHVSVEGFRRLFFSYPEPLEGGYLHHSHDDAAENSSDDDRKKDIIEEDTGVCCLSELSLEFSTRFYFDEIFVPAAATTEEKSLIIPITFPFLQKFEVVENSYYSMRDWINNQYVIREETKTDYLHYMLDNCSSSSLTSIAFSTKAEVHFPSRLRSVTSNIHHVKNNLRELCLAHCTFLRVANNHHKDDTQQQVQSSGGNMMNNDDEATTILLEKQQHPLICLKELVALERLVIVDAKASNLFFPEEDRRKIATVGKETSASCFLPVASLESLELIDISSFSEPITSCLFERIGSWFSSSSQFRNENNDEEKVSKPKLKKFMLHENRSDLSYALRSTPFSSSSLLKLEANHLQELHQISTLEFLSIRTNTAFAKDHERKELITQLLEEEKKKSDDSNTSLKSSSSTLSSHNKLLAFFRANDEEDAISNFFDAENKCWTFSDEDYIDYLKLKLKMDTELLFEKIPNLKDVKIV